MLDIITNMREIIDKQINDLEASLKESRENMDKIDPSYYAKWSGLLDKILNEERKLQQLLAVKKTLKML